MSCDGGVLFDGTVWDFVLLLGGVFAVGVQMVLACFTFRAVKRARLQSLRHDCCVSRDKCSSSGWFSRLGKARVNLALLSVYRKRSR